MSLKKIDGLQSEIFVPITPKPVFTKVTKPLKDMTIAIVTAAGVHLKTDTPFNLAGDTSYRAVPGTAKDEELMVSHGGYDNTDVNRDINSMFPIDRLRELADEGFIKGVAPYMYTCMGGGGDVKVFTDKTGPEIAQRLLDEKVDAVVMTAG
jgi:D-proline reductase (dithiol) PrdB